jgi:hypothetical protein
MAKIEIELVTNAGNSACTIKQIQYIEALCLRKGYQKEYMLFLNTEGSLAARKHLTILNAYKWITCLKTNAEWELTGYIKT